MPPDPPPHIKRARRLRQEANTPEEAAWTVLRELRAYGFPVRRQHPIGPYTVDFAIQKAKLVIEIDGGIHALEEVRLRDAERQNVIEALGWRVLRIDAEKALSGDHLWAEVTAALGL
ncbi:MAG: endonuclease domain-containing protein [Hyphomonas sp.]